MCITVNTWFADQEIQRKGDEEPGRNWRLKINKKNGIGLLKKMNPRCHCQKLTILFDLTLIQGTKN